MARRKKRGGKGKEKDKKSKEETKG